MKQIDIILTERAIEPLRKGGSLEKEEHGVRVYVAASREAQTKRKRPVLTN